MVTIFSWWPWAHPNDGSTMLSHGPSPPQAEYKLTSINHVLWGRIDVGICPHQCDSLGHDGWFSAWRNLISVFFRHRRQSNSPMQIDDRLERHWRSIEKSIPRKACLKLRRSWLIFGSVARKIDVLVSSSKSFQIFGFPSESHYKLLFLQANESFILSVCTQGLLSFHSL